MANHKFTTRFLRKRKMLLVLPLLILPFITMIFWSLGGGEGNEVIGQQQELKGFNVELPSPVKDDSSVLSKLSFYEKADKDSIQFNELIKTDPYYRNTRIKNNDSNATSLSMLSTLSGEQTYKGSNDPIESKVYSKLNELNKHLEISTASGKTQPQTIVESNAAPIASEDVDRLEGLMKMMKDDKQYTDPEMQQLDKMLEKIIAIQHPEQERVKVQIAMDTSSINLATTVQSTPAGFYTSISLDTGSLKQRSIQAEVYNTQTLVNGSTIQLIILQDVYIQNIFLPQGTKIYGTCTFDNDRLKVQVSYIKNQQSIINVKMEAYDLDGLPGLYIPGNISRDVLTQSASEITQSFGMSSVDPSLVAKATEAGIDMAKNLLSKKVKPLKVSVKAGYQLLLVNEQ